MILTRHNLPAPICQLAHVPDAHMYTSLTLKRTAIGAEFTRKNNVHGVCCPGAADLADLPRGTHPNPPIPHSQTHTHTNMQHTIQYSVLSTCDSRVKSTLTGQSLLTVRPSCQCERDHICYVCKCVCVCVRARARVCVCVRVCANKDVGSREGTGAWIKHGVCGLWSCSNSDDVLSLRGVTIIRHSRTNKYLSPVLLVWGGICYITSLFYNITTCSAYLPQSVKLKHFLSCHNAVLMLWLGLGTKTTWLVLGKKLPVLQRFFK